MKVNLELEGREDEIVELEIEDVSVLLGCDSLGHRGKYYKITSKIFEIVSSNGKKCLTIIGEENT